MKCRIGRVARPCFYIFILLLFICLPTRVIAQSIIEEVTTIPEHINDFVKDTSFTHAGISICFRDASSGDIIADYHKDMALGSASVMKLVTTAVAVEMLGPGFRFTTMIGYTGIINEADSSLDGHIIIKGGADPTLLSEYFPEHNAGIIEKWADAVYNAGIRKVKGAVVADATIFNYHPAPGGWNWSDLGNYYGAGAHGICIYDNMYRIHFKTGKPGSRPEITAVEPEIPGLVIENRLVSAGDKDNGYVYLEPYGDHAVIRGEIPPLKDDFILKASIPDPPLLTAIILRKALEDRGIIIEQGATSLRLSPQIKDDFRSAPKTVLITTWSPPMSQIIKQTNTESLNLYAEQLLKYIAYRSDFKEYASKNKGIEATEHYLEYLMNDYDGLYMNDGSGLSRSNAISSSFISSLLHVMNTGNRYNEEFFNSLPEAGSTGTLRYYFRDPVFNGRLRAKSGTSTRIRNYAGYITVSTGQRISFAVLVNNFDCSSSEVTGKVEKLLKGVIEGYQVPGPRLRQGSGG